MSAALNDANNSPRRGGRGRGVVVAALLGGVVGFSLISLDLRRGLPMDLTPLAALRSGEQSVVLDRDDAVAGRFSLMEPLDGQPGDDRDVVRGLIAVSEPERFERPRGARPSVLGALWRVAHGLPPRASEVAVELADALAPGARGDRRSAVRRDLLAARIDAVTTVEERVAAWLQWVPLCRGLRGVARATRDCLGVRGARSALDAAAIAAAARWGLDLADERPLLAVRRDAVLDALLREGALQADALLDVGGVPAPMPLGDGPTALLELAFAEGRAARGRHADPLRVRTTLDMALQDRLAAAGADACLVVDPKDGAILAGAGDPDRPRNAADLAALADLDDLPPGPGRELLEPLDRPSLRRAVSLLLALAGDGRTRQPWLVRGVASARGEDVSGPPDAVRLLGAEDAFRRLIQLPERGPVRAARLGDMLLLAHPARVAACWRGDGDTLLAALTEGLSARRFSPPDGLVLRWVDGQAVAAPRSGQSTTQRTPGPGAQRSAIDGTDANGAK